jgi:hypothetical protein
VRYWGLLHEFHLAQANTSKAHRSVSLESPQTIHRKLERVFITAP